MIRIRVLKSDPDPDSEKFENRTRIQAKAPDPSGSNSEIKKKIHMPFRERDITDLNRTEQTNKVETNFGRKGVGYRDA